MTTIYTDLNILSNTRVKNVFRYKLDNGYHFLKLFKNVYILLLNI